MTDEPLFSADLLIGQMSALETQCDSCPTRVVSSMNALRVGGWIAYDGQSVTNRPLRVRICPACQRRNR